MRYTDSGSNYHSWVVLQNGDSELRVHRTNGQYGKVDDKRKCGIGSFATDEVERNTRGDEVTHKGGAIKDLAANIVEQITRTDEVEHGNCGGIGSDEKELERNKGMKRK